MKEPSPVILLSEKNGQKIGKKFAAASQASLTPFLILCLRRARSCCWHTEKRRIDPQRAAERPKELPLSEILIRKRAASSKSVTLPNRNNGNYKRRATGRLPSTPRRKAKTKHAQNFLIEFAQDGIRRRHAKRLRDKIQYRHCIPTISVSPLSNIDRKIVKTLVLFYFASLNNVKKKIKNRSWRLKIGE
jgi:hypothetical protein